MIAVFGNSREFRLTSFHPKKMFKWIDSPERLHGIRWSGIVLLYGWHHDKSMVQAYDYLEVRQPELFKK